MIQRDSSGKLDIRTVVLIGGRDFGRCPLDLPTALWPVADVPVLRRLLDHLAEEGIESAAVCCGRELSGDVETACAGSRLNVTIVAEELTSGTAGCVRDAVGSDPGDLILVLSASMVAPPPIKDLIEAHRVGGAALSMVFNPGDGNRALYGSPAEIYLCRPDLLTHIPGGGYSDMKEGVIPSVLRAGGTVHPILLERDVGNLRDRRGYLRAINIFLQSDTGRRCGSGMAEHEQEGPILEGADAFVHSTARICGPAVIGERARVLEGAVVIGPAMIGHDTVLGENSVIVRSAIWAGAAVGAGCRIRESIVGYRAAIREGTEVAEQARVADAADRKVGRQLVRYVGGRVVRIGASVQSWCDRLDGRLPGWVPFSSRQLAYAVGGIVILAAFLWSYWPTITDLMAIWNRSDEYSSGLLVPFLAAYVVWTRREDLARVRVRPVVLWGVAAFLLAQVIRGTGLYLMFHSAERLSLVLSVAALVLLVMGWAHLRKLAWILVFLFLMFPWPKRVESAVTEPLQRWATTSAVFCLEVGGYEIERQGNSNVFNILGHERVAVAEACNGLRMITAFFVISGLVALLVKRAWWEKLAVIVSSVPIALLSNTLRLAITAVLFTIVQGEDWKQRFHDWDGYAMMPLAIGMVVGELWLLARLTTPPVAVEPAIISRRAAKGVPDS
jgi:exosortase